MVVFALLQSPGWMVEITLLYKDVYERDAGCYLCDYSYIYYYYYYMLSQHNTNKNDYMNVVQPF